MTFNVIVIGAGAAGMMAAATAAQRGRNVLLLDHASEVGQKILISGGGRCNFTNYNIEPEAYLSENKHFCKSALARYTQWDFISLVEKHKIAYHEKKLGQLFCDNHAQDIVQMLLAECKAAKVSIQLKTTIENITKREEGNYLIQTSRGKYKADSVIVATGGLSLPKIGATPFAYQLAEKFGLQILPTRPGLVPLTSHEEDKKRYSKLSGISLPITVQSENKMSFSESMLFTHRGLSGPAILQISSYWKPGEKLTLDLLPEIYLEEELAKQKNENPNLMLQTVLSRMLPKRLIKEVVELGLLPDRPLKQYNEQELRQVAEFFHAWTLLPNGTEGYRTAEVTLGGIDTHEISSKTMEAKKSPGLYFIGEALDVTGWLGGYNFQWAWSSGWSAGEYA